MVKYFHFLLFHQHMCMCSYFFTHCVCLESSLWLLSMLDVNSSTDVTFIFLFRMDVSLFQLWELHVIFISIYANWWAWTNIFPLWILSSYHKFRFIGIICFKWLHVLGLYISYFGPCALNVMPFSIDIMSFLLLNCEVFISNRWNFELCWT